MTTDPDGASATHRKALELNLDPSSYGTFAEIGAGQEVANWFLRVGAASGTVAQTICAYDKGFSDERYGQGTRYVSRERLLAMLDREFQPLEGQLRAARGPQMRFFAFADTIAARNFKGDNEQHGWVGIRFQRESGGAPSDVLLHVELRDRDVAQQREALGVLGVNLVHAAFHQRLEPEPFLRAMFEDLSTDRLEVDVIELRGTAFAATENRLWCLEALRQGICRGLVFDETGQANQPSTVLRKRALVVGSQGSAAGLDNPLRVISAAFDQLKREGGTLEREPITVLDLRLRELFGSSSGIGSAALDHLGRFTARSTVVITDQVLLYPVVQYLRRYSSGPFRLVDSVLGFARMLSANYATLPGALLEGLAKLLLEDVKLYVYPVPLPVFAREQAQLERITTSSQSGVVSVDDLRCEPPLDHLLRYLRGAEWIVPLEVPPERRAPEG
jgi:hypothetical protein